MIHNISYRAFVYGTENKEKVLNSIKTLFPNSSPQCEATEGYYKNSVLILYNKIDKKREIKDFVEKLSTMNDPARKRIINRLEDKMDDDGNLYLRFDKQRAYLGDLKVVEHGDSIHLKIKIAAYPAKKKVAIEIARKLFE
jgi:RNA binding exosome subunit